jgi:peptidoglycan/xylan/chitin deacetylase (PgdA/CDA1 family)
MVPSKALIITATALLSVCASVFTFFALTKIEARMENKRLGGGGDKSTAMSRGYDQDAVYRYAEPSFSTAETAFPKTYTEPVSDDLPLLSSTIQPSSTQMLTQQPSTRLPRKQSQAYILPGGASLQAGREAPFMIDNASTDINLFALTFDGGSHANAADDIFDTLASRGVKSTMFLTGAFIKRYTQTVIRAASDGHELGNHTMNHPRLTTYADDSRQSTRPEISRMSIIDELTATERLLAERAGGLRFAPLWRAPYGEYNREICSWAVGAGYVHIGWRKGGAWRVNLDTNDWIPNAGSPGYKSPQEVFDKIIAIASRPGGLNGGIILMHLGTERKQRSQQVHTILGRMIDTLRGMGYEPVTVSSLLYQSGIDVNVVLGM